MNDNLSKFNNDSKKSISEHSKKSLSDKSTYDSSKESYSQSSFLKLWHRQGSTNDKYINNLSRASGISTQTLQEDTFRDINGKGADGREIKTTSQLQIQSVLTFSFLNQYMIIDTVGRGSFGKVKLCLNLNFKQLNAIKFIDKTSQKFRLQLLRKKIGNQQGKDMQDEAEETTKNEIKAMTKLQKHPNVVQLFEIIDDPQNSQVLLVMEYIDGGPIMNLDNDGNSQKKFPEELARNHLIGIANGLKYLHENGVIHGDIKPSNLFLSFDGRVCIGDFGSARHVLEGEKLQESSNGTPAFLSPERCLSNMEYDGVKADVWAVGITLYLLVFGKLPELISKFTDKDTSQTMKDCWHREEYRQNIINEQGQMMGYCKKTMEKTNDQYNQKIQQMCRNDDLLDFPEDVEVSYELKDLLRSILRIRPDNRLTVDEILQHSWTTGRNQSSSDKKLRQQSVMSKTWRTLTPQNTGVKIHNSSSGSFSGNGNGSRNGNGSSVSGSGTPGGSSHRSGVSFISQVSGSVSERGSEKRVGQRKLQTGEVDPIKAPGVDIITSQMKFKTRRYKKGDLILTNDINLDGIYYIEKGITHSKHNGFDDRQPQSQVNLMNYLKPDDDFWQDYDSLEIMGALVDQSIIVDMNKSQEKCQSVVNGIVQQQLLNRPQALRELHKRLSKMEESRHNMLIKFGQMHIPQGFMCGLNMPKKCSFQIIAQGDVTVKFLSYEDLKKHLSQFPEDGLVLEGCINYCRSELYRQMFIGKAYKARCALSNALKMMNGQMDSSSQTTAEDFKESKRLWQARRPKSQNEISKLKHSITSSIIRSKA